MRIAIVLISVVSLLGTQYAATAEESLGAAAARERERRKGKAPKVITESDLSRAGGSTLATPDEATTIPTSSDSSAPAAGAAGGAKAGEKKEEKEKTDEELREEAMVDWRKRMDQANAEVSAAQAEVTRLESSTAAYLRGDQLTQARQALTAAQAKVSALEDERRQKGYR
jgi:hypothetical protein